MAKVDRSILAANDQRMGQFGDPDKLENSIAHIADTVDTNDTETQSLKTDNLSNKNRLNVLENDNTSNKKRITITEQDIDYTEGRLTELLRNNQQASEVVDARLGFPVLREKIENIDIFLEENKHETHKIRDFISSENERIAHRGFSGAYPENTMIAFGKAIEAGFESLEWDVQISSDGFPVVIHDSTVDRTTNGTGNVKDKTLANLRTLDAGSKYSAFYAGAKIPTLEEVLQISKGVSKFIYPEIKDFRTIDDTLIITQAIIDSGLEDKCVIQAANFNCFSYVRSLSRSITLGYLIGSAGEFANALNQAKTDSKAVIIAEQYILINNPSFVQQARSEGIDIVAWTVDTSRAMKKLRDIGVVRVMQNHLRSVVR